MKRDEFLKKAGGVFEYGRYYSNFRGSDKYDFFWSFFLDKNYGWVRSVYGDIPIEELYRNGHSIEHVVPKSVLKKQLRSVGRPERVVMGATVNPLNFTAAYNHLNSARGIKPFDTENDGIEKHFRVPLNPYAAVQTGLDYENEWVIPSRSQGDIARCVLYMMVTYGLKGLYEEDIDQMLKWCLVDPPQPWEIAYNQWVYTKFSIRNPLITEDMQELKTMLNPQTFEDLLKPVMPVVIRPKMQGLENGYCVLTGKMESFRRDADFTPHMLFRVRHNNYSWQGAVNVQSNNSIAVNPQAGFPENNLMIYIDYQYQHAITDDIDNAQFAPGITMLETNDPTLDYVRGNLFDKRDMMIMPAVKDGLDNDIFEKLEEIFSQAIAEDATIYAFGEPYENGRGIHSIHMNQGSIIKKYQKTDGVFQDGALFIKFADRWVAVFTAFQSQSWNTDNITGRAVDIPVEPEPQPYTDRQSMVSDVRLVYAIPNPVGVDKGKESVKILNLRPVDVDLSGWQLVDRQGRSESLSGVISDFSSKLITLSGKGAILSNSGSSIKLVDPDGREVHEVGYSRSQADRQGGKVLFSVLA